MIRPATNDDIPEIVELGRVMHAESQYSTVPYSGDKVASSVAEFIDCGVVFVAENDGLIIGGIACGIAEHWFSEEKYAFEHALFIHPDFRKGATAVRLISAFFEWANLLGAKSAKMGITTGVNVERIAKLYRAIGLVEVGPLFQKAL